MSRPDSPPNRVQTILSDVLKRVGPEQELRAYNVWTFWNDEVGALIARRAQPARVRNGILFVTVASHSWMQELQYMKEALRERINARLGAPLIRDIFFISGHLDVATESEPPAAAPLREVETLVVPVLPDIADPELAAAFARLAHAQARRSARLARAGRRDSARNKR